MKSPYYTKQIDETTVDTNDAQLICYIRYRHIVMIHLKIFCFVEHCKPVQLKKTYSLS